MISQSDPSLNPTVKTIWNVPARRLAHSLAVAAILLLALLPLAACGKKEAPQSLTGQGDGGASSGGARPELPERGVGLASLAVFPELGTPLKVINTQPADGADGVTVHGDDARILVQFNHPVVPLVSVEEQGDLPVPAEIEPEIDGEAEWLNTSTWMFTPGADFAPATRYTVKVASGLKDVLGGTLGEAVEVTFVTASPVVADTYPEARRVHVGPREPISVTFSTPMNQASAEQAFSLRKLNEKDEPVGEAVGGSFKWVDGEMAFTPGADLDRATEYLATIAAGARAATGDAATKDPYNWRFTVAPMPVLTGSNPRDGDRASTWLREHGALELRFNTPMDTAGVTVTLQPTITNQSLWWNDQDRTLGVDGGWLASEAYTVTLESTSRSRWGDALGEDKVIHFTLAPIAPTFQLKSTGNFSLYSGYTPQLAYADAINVPSATFDLYRVPPADLVRLNIADDRWEQWDRYAPQTGDRLRRWAVDLSAPLNVPRRISTTLSTAPNGLLEPGAYYLRAGDVPGDAQRTVYLVSNTNLTLKRAADEVLVWATDLRSGKPVAGLPITMYGKAVREHTGDEEGLEESDQGNGEVQEDDRPAAAGDVLARGSTDVDGVFRAPLAVAVDAWQPIVALSEMDGRVVAATSSDWSEGIGAYDFNFGYDAGQRPYYANAYTDRPIYRAGQTVYYRGVLRSDDDAVYLMPDVQSVHATVRDPDYETVLEADLPVSAFGTVNGQTELSPAARLGGYSIELAVGPESERDTIANAYFQVSAYRKPEFQAEVVTDKPEYRQGETIHATASASYYFGGPVADADVTWRLVSDDYFFSPKDVEGWWEFIDYDLIEDRYNDAQGEVTSSGQGKTDADGRFSFEVPADISEYPLSQVFTLDVEVTDTSHQVVAMRTSAVVHKSDLYVGLQARDYVGERGKPVGFNILALTPESKPVPSQAVDLAFYQRTWYSVREKLEDGGFYWTSHYTDTLVAESTVTTDAAGEAAAEFIPKEGGVHRLVATAKDGAGNEARSATYTWITGRGYINWRQENNDRIDLVADKKEYAPGETAEILVPAPFAGAEALITIERGKIRDVRRLTLPGNSETIRVPIRSDYTPNVYVSVVLVKGVGPDSPLPQLKLGYTNLAVSTVEKKLDIAIQPDKAVYGPREKVTYAIDVKDHAGQPVQAELSLALVDKALLALADDTSTSLIDAFYGQRMLGVATSASLTESANRLNQELQAEKKGGGGGLTETGTVRRLFRDTAYWNAAVVTGQDGRAELSLDLPDNLTMWNLNVRGITGADTRVGSATDDITSTMAVLVRPVIPRFFVVGDTVQLETVVNNQTDKDIQVDVSIATTGLTLTNAAPQPLSVPAGGNAKVVWQAEVPATGLNPPTAPEAFGEVSVQMGAKGDGYTDSVEQKLPVYQFSEAQVVATAGQVRAGETEVTEQIKLPDEVDPSQGELKVELNPSLAAAVVDSLTWLRAFPYDCSEQTTSKFLPNAATYLALDKLDLRGDRLEEVKKKLEQVVPVQLQRLYTLQNTDGGWGWWRDESRPWLTAYALYGMMLAREAGFAVSEDAMARATEYLQNSLNRTLDVRTVSDPNQRAFVLWVLAQRDGIPVSRVLALYDRRSQMSHFGRAFLALALARAGGAEQQGRVDGLIADLGGAARVSATGAAWSEDQSDPWTMSTDTRTTAIAILALSQLAPDNPNLPGAIKWLMIERQEGHWETTQETAWAILGLTDYMRTTGELNANYNYHIELNDAELGKGTVDASNVDQPVELDAPVSDMRAGHLNPLTIRRDGPGQLYYNAHLRLYTPVDKLEPVARGIVVGRQYFAVDPATYQPTTEAVDSVKIGDVVQVKLTIITDEPRNYVAVEDPIPAGFEIIDTSLKTTSSVAQGPQLEEVQDDDEGEAVPWWRREWWSWWVDSQLLDDKAVFFATRLPAGTYEYTYMIRASVAGNYNVIPAHAEEMYFPEVFGRSAGGVVSVGF